jgi:hypothetical protein
MHNLATPFLCKRVYHGRRNGLGEDFTMYHIDVDFIETKPYGGEKNYRKGRFTYHLSYNLVEDDVDILRG